MPDTKEQVPAKAAQVQEVYVGPRPFERSERRLFFGRDREISELLSLVTSSRVVLCYAPSGAGKTSLINAGLQPRLEKEGFEVLPSTRVRGLIPEGVDQAGIANIYVFNAILSLAKETGVPAELTRCTMSEYLSTVPHLTDEEDFPSPRILIFDQFEELLTSYVERWQERDGFFHQVHDALQADPLLRVLFVMREDFVARIEPFMRFLKPLPQSRFRLDLLGPVGAQAAVTGPLRDTGKHFKDGVVDSLIAELLKVRVESTQGEATEVIGEYVEPVQLQVVCRNLWMSLPADVQEISQEHVTAYGDVDQALREFYEACVTEARASLRANEMNLRQWFEQSLITPAGTRSIVFRDTQLTAGLPNPIVDFLENKHIIRGEWRAGSRWYELTHDRLIEPIQRANRQWRAKRQARTSRILTFAGGAVVLALVLFSAVLSLQKSGFAAPSDESTAVAEIRQTLVSESSSFVVDAQSTASVAQEDASLSKSRQLAAEALLANDRELSLLLAIEANKSFDTLEARRSLHKILSRQSIADGEFLRAFDPNILSPSLGASLDDHNGPVIGVAFGPDGQRFVSGSVNGTVLLWDVATAQPIGPSLTTKSSGIGSVAYSPDGLLVASAGQEQQISLWNASTGEPYGSPLRGHGSLVTCLAFSPDGKLLASGGLDFQLFIWDVATQELVAEFKNPDTFASIAWSPDGKYLAAGTFGATVSFWSRSNTYTFEEVDMLSGFNGPVRAIAWSLDSRVIAMGFASDEDAPEYGDVLLWDFDNRKPIVHPLPDDGQRVRAVAFDSAGKTLAIGRDDGTIVFWDTQRRQIVGEPLEAHKHRVMSIAFSRDGRSMISAGYDGKVAIWNLQAPTRSLASSPKGDLLATSQGSVISVWDLSTEQAGPTKVLFGHTDDILVLAFSPDGNSLVSSGKDKTIKFWDIDLGRQIVSELLRSIVPTLQFSPDGSSMALAGESGRVQLYDLATGVSPNLIELSGPVLKVQFGEGGETLQVAGQDGSLTTLDMRSGEVAEKLDALPGAEGGIVSIAFSQDGKRAAYFQEGGAASLGDDGRAHGIYLSFWDQSFDPTVNPNDIDFIIVRATDGTQYVDPTFEEYLKPIQSVSMRGAYHFFRENQSWQEQADRFLSIVKDKGFHFYVLGLEVNPGDGSTQFLADAEQWLKYVDDKVEGKVLLETGSFYLTQFGPAAEWMKDWPLMVAQYPLEPDRDGSPALPKGFADWKIWNYSEKGKATEYGTAGDSVYLQVYNGTPLEMGEWLGINTFTIFDRGSGALIHPKQAIQITSPNGIAFSPDGSYLATADEGVVSLLNAETGDEISTLAIGGLTVLSLDFTPNSNSLAIGTDDGTVLLWDLSLLRPGTKTESMINVACSQVQQNFSLSEWAQYLPGADYSPTCPDVPTR